MARHLTSIILEHNGVLHIGQLYSGQTQWKFVFGGVKISGYFSARERRANRESATTVVCVSLCSVCDPQLVSDRCCARN